MELQPDFLTRMKRSTNLNIQVVNMNNRAISLGMSLQGFAASYDGEPVDPKAYEEPPSACRPNCSVAARRPSAASQSSSASSRAVPRSRRRSRRPGLACQPLAPPQR